ncbi:addiction module toxin RelE [Hafnia paralvei]|uniref:Addiction module toxin RelE n=1 Tax=Hafnia paralvei TaxID=546367 RepID=A0A2A2MBT2_9GAMM|nr:addiction module toxin RelE [Hafnia paralvei]RDA70294.1 addiction module toxin RelE [Hafnia paralvei]RDA70892.1 addiction module toxin RelE [Hafnia paralvei]RDA71797.1 addiction module toxin RelE [Hafnia paralvei]RDA79681.1 addiction module toxin RelE [Hafnia paralvei]
MRVTFHPLYAKSFKLHQGGKRANPQTRTYVHDWGERVQPTQRQHEG